MNSISFKAKFVHNAVIKSRKPNGRYKEIPVSIVKVSKKEADRNAIQNVSMRWEGAGFVEAMILDYFNQTPDEDLTMYALTQQKDNFRKLQPNMILGLADVEKNPKNFKIRYLQARPDCVHKKKKKPFKGIGEALMKSIIALTKDKKIYLSTVDEAQGFYKKLGFKFVFKDLREPLMVLKKSAK